MNNSMLQAPGLPTFASVPEGLRGTVPSAAKLVDAIRQASGNRASVTHGESHWKCVAWTGLDLAGATPGADPVVVFLFALLHDSCRHPDGPDALHGQRAAELAEALIDRGLIALTARQELLLQAALRRHHEQATSRCATVGVCWDADRLQRWRLGGIPTPDTMSTAAARCPKRIAKAKAQAGAGKDWLAIFSGYELLQMMQAC